MPKWSAFRYKIRPNRFKDALYSFQIRTDEIQRNYINQQTSKYTIEYV